MVYCIHIFLLINSQFSSSKFAHLQNIPADTFPLGQFLREYTRWPFTHMFPSSAAERHKHYISRETATETISSSFNEKAKSTGTEDPDSVQLHRIPVAFEEPPLECYAMQFHLGWAFPKAWKLHLYRPTILEMLFFSYLWKTSFGHPTLNNTCRLCSCTMKRGWSGEQGWSV